MTTTGNDTNGWRFTMLDPASQIAYDALRDAEARRILVAACENVVSAVARLRLAAPRLRDAAAEAIRRGRREAACTLRLWAGVLEDYAESLEEMPGEVLGEGPKGG